MTLSDLMNAFHFLTHFFLVLHLLNENYGCRGAIGDASWFDRSGQGGDVVKWRQMIGSRHP